MKERFPRKNKHTNTNTQIRGEVLLLGFPLTLSTQWVLAPNTSVQYNTEMIICDGVTDLKPKCYLIGNPDQRKNSDIFINICFSF